MRKDFLQCWMICNHFVVIVMQNFANAIKFGMPKQNKRYAVLFICWGVNGRAEEAFSVKALIMDLVAKWIQRKETKTEIIKILLVYTFSR